jgi:RNA polymerase sigma-70 factor, ECF subfamily
VRGLRNDERTEDGQRMAADSAVVRRAADDPAGIFSALVDRHLDSAYRLASVILGDPAEAEDAAHDAAVLAWRSFGSLRDRSRFEPWLCRIVTNVCRDRLRSRLRHPVSELPSDDDPTLPAIADSTGRVAVRDAIGGAFELLDPDERIVIAMRFYRDLQIEEIASRLGLPSGTVKSRLHRALGRMRVEMTRRGWREDRDG